MKKLVAISVLFAGLAMAVFAQDGGWSNPWKVGFSATYVTDLFYAAKANGTSKTTTETTGSVTTSLTTEYGDYLKGVTHLFPNSKPLGYDIGGDHRLGVQLSNNGENYDIRVDIDLDDWISKIGDGGVTVGQFLLNGASKTDWMIKGTAGIFSAGLGPASADSMAFVGINQIWGSWIGWNMLNRFGVWRQDSGWIHSAHFRTMDTWGSPFWVGIALGDNFKFNLGYRFDNWDVTIGNGKDSRSSINGSFMLSGRPVDAVTFDLFYTVRGEDENTDTRPIFDPSDGWDYSPPVAKWKNMIGAYFGINGIENLSLSVGYTANFNVYEAGSYVDPVAAAAATGDDYLLLSKPVTYNAPVYHGIDLRVGYSGIDKIGLNFLTNVSLASVKGVKIDEDASGNRKYKEKVNFLFDESTYDAGGRTQDWFSWQAILQANLGFIDGVGIEVALGNLLQVNSGTYKDTVATTTYDNTDKTTTNDFRVTVGAKYGIGNVNFGVALWLGLNSTFTNTVTKTTTGSVTTTRTTVGTDNEVKFGVPFYFQVSF